MNSTQAKEKVLSMIQADFGKSFEDLKTEVFDNYKKSGYGCSDHFKSPNGYSIFYTDNNNFMQGVKNGGGKGYFARLYFVGMSSNVKLSN